MAYKVGDRVIIAADPSGDLREERGTVVSINEEGAVLQNDLSNWDPRRLRGRILGVLLDGSENADAFTYYVGSDWVRLEPPSA